MADDKPLHVQVAEALGRKVELIEGDWYVGKVSPTRSALVPRYDTSWCATGPLIAKYGIELFTLWPGDRGQDGFRWGAQTGADNRSPEHHERMAEGPTPLLAVCILLLQLHKAGKLNP